MKKRMVKDKKSASLKKSKAEVIKIDAEIVIPDELTPVLMMPSAVAVPATV